MAKKTTSVKRVPPVKKAAASKARCGLCGSSRKKLMVTDCCGNFICDDQHKYVLFSYDRNSCARNHDRYTVCGYHFHEGHKGLWRECKQCEGDFDAEDYVEMATNDYNFETLKVVPEFEPTYCCECNDIIERRLGGYSVKAGKFSCPACTNKALAVLAAKPSPTELAILKPL